jgi:hypothetical protein
MSNLAQNNTERPSRLPSRSNGRARSAERLTDTFVTTNAAGARSVKRVIDQDEGDHAYDSLTQALDTFVWPAWIDAKRAAGIARALRRENPARVDVTDELPAKFWLMRIGKLVAEARGTDGAAACGLGKAPLFDVLVRTTSISGDCDPIAGMLGEIETLLNQLCDRLSDDQALHPLAYMAYLRAQAVEELYDRRGHIEVSALERSGADADDDVTDEAAAE